jgi:tetratricopeptide (TPR) repeat protein
MKNERITQLFEFYTQNPHDTFVLYAIANEYNTQNDPGKALEYYGELLSQDPNYLGAYYQIAKIHEKMGDLSLAIFFYKKGIRIATTQNDLKTLQELHQALILIDDDDED